MISTQVAFEATCDDGGGAGSFELHERFDDRYQRAVVAFRRRWGVTVEDYGYILTDLWLLEMRRRGGCDFIHVTNGDNIYHVDFFRHQLAVFNARPDVGSTAVDFYCHLWGRFQSVAFRIAHIDLGCMLVRPSAMRNMTFAVRLFEDGTWRRRLDGVNHAHAVNRTTHKERVARRRREWKLNRTRTRDAQRKHTHAESATCYGRRYPDLAYHFCEKGGCDVHALHDHFRDHGREEGRRFGCEAAPLTPAEAARFPRPQVDQGRLHAADGFFAAELARRAPAVPIHDHGPLFFHF